MSDYKKINYSHRLSSFEIALPLWKGTKRVRIPFGNWANEGVLSWYQAYNATKHDRHNEFKQASFENLIESVSGLIAILSAQFWQEDFISSASFLVIGDSADGMNSAIGNYFRIRFPDDWPEEEKYDFTYEDINKPEFKIEKFNYKNIIGV